MAVQVLIINGHDYSRFIESKGVSWTRNDLDSDDSGRTIDTIMHRAKIGAKRTCAYKLINMSRSEMAQLDSDLSAETFSATYLDLHGRMTKTFYCSKFSCTLETAYDNDGEWGDATFTMIEV